MIVLPCLRATPYRVLPAFQVNEGVRTGLRMIRRTTHVGPHRASRTLGGSTGLDLMPGQLW